MNKYSSYKQSNIDWVGEIPSHWEIVPPKYKLNKITRQIEEGDEVITCFRDGVVTLRKNRREDGFTNSIKEHGYQQIHPGDLVVHEMDGFAGAIGISDSKGKSTPVYTVIKPDHRTDLKYVSFLLREMSQTGKIESLAKSIRERTTDFRWNMWSVIDFPFPPVEEQKLISLYLEKKTNQIDLLVDKIQKKIQVLKEQRTSLINHYVTRGLNQNQELKHSGVDWIGDIPKHWNISKFKYVTNLYSGNSLNEYQKNEFQSENPEDIPYISSRDIDAVLQNINYDNGLRIPRNNNNFKIAPKGSFLMVIEGGSAGKKIAFLEQEVCFVNKLCVFNSKENTKYQYYFVQSKIYQNKFESLISGLIGGVSISNLKSIELILPSLQEQNDIVDVLDEKTKKIDLLIEMENNRISLLTEQRKSLISAVVKGKYKINEDML